MRYCPKFLQRLQQFVGDDACIVPLDGPCCIACFQKTISLTHHAFSQTSPPPAANQAAFLCSFPVLWQLSPAALDFTHQNLYNKIKYYRFCGKEVRSWISPANTASIPCAYRAAIPPATANPASSTHRQMNDEQLIAAGVQPDLVRMSCGLEDKNDLIHDIAQALDQI